MATSTPLMWGVASEPSFRSLLSPACTSRGASREAHRSTSMSSNGRRFPQPSPQAHVLEDPQP